VSSAFGTSQVILLEWTDQNFQFARQFVKQIHQVAEKLFDLIHHERYRGLEKLGELLPPVEDKKQ